MRTLLSTLLFSFLLSACSEELPIIDDLSGDSWELTNQDSIKYNFPDYLSGKPFIAGYIFTNCPDICPLTTNNMRRVQQKLIESGFEDMNFVSISFDPKTDAPHVLKKFATVRGLDLSRWQFFTGSDSAISSLMSAVDVFYAPGDSTVFPDGRTVYYFVHTDRISLFDSKGRIRKNYRGSKADIEEIVADAKLLMEE